MGFDGLYDRRRARPSARRVKVRIVEQVLGLYREHYFDFSMRHFHEKLREDFMKPLELTVNSLTLELHVAATRIGEIVHGRRRITAETARG